MNELQVVNTILGNLDCFIDENNKFWFAATEAAKVLGYKNPRDAILKHCVNKGIITLSQNTTQGNSYNKSFMTEGNLYRLTIKSKLPEAVKFEEQVFEEILPTIRKHGAYMTPSTLEQAISNPDFAIGLLTALKDEQEKNRQLEHKIEKDEPLVTFANQVTDSKGCIDMNAFAKIIKDENINIGRNRLFKWLREEGYLMGNNLPYQKYIEYFKVVETVKGDSVYSKTLITGKGQIKLLEALTKAFN